MSELRTAQQFRNIDQARDELARRKAGEPRWAAQVDRFFAEEAILALLSDHPEASRPSVQSVLSGKTLKDQRLHTQILSGQRALQALTEYAAAGGDLEEVWLPTLHRKLREGVDLEAGQYRAGPVKSILPGYTPMDAGFLGKALRNTFAWTATASFKEIHPVEQAALVCARLLEIQPFAAGNINVAQLMATLPLLRHGYPPALFRREDQPNFLRALSMAFLLAMQELIDLYVQTVQRLLDEAGRLKG